MILSKSVIAPSDAQRSRWNHDDFRRQKAVVKQFTERQQSTPYLIGPPNAGGFSVLKNIEYEDRLPLNATVARLSSFESLRLLPVVRNALYGRALRQLDEKRPSAIQALAIQKMMRLPPPTNLHKMKVKLKSYLLAAETGSGKTLAYLLPLFSMLKEEELQNAPAVWDLPQRPYIRSIILVPTAELVQQVLVQVKDMCHEIKLASAGLSQESTRGVADGIRKKQIDILVATPVPLLKLIHRTSWNILDDCRKIVVDEADSLMDRSFKDETQEILDTPPRLETLVFCSATIPKTFDRTLAQKYPDMERIVAPHLHQIPRRITFSTVDTAAKPFFNDKRKALAETLYNLDRSDTDPGKVKRIVIFVNHRESVSGIVEYLNGLKIPTVGLTRDNSLEERSSLMREFIRLAPLLKDAKDLNLVTGSVKTLRVLVTTDIFSRGIDMQSVRTIILYDVPFSSIDLIHRAGRTGRMGRRGRVILLATKSELRPWLRGLATTINKGYALV
ncbi:P-loop containing nucleoside triphosphate hydrolase protein [Lipomyces starkeyi]